MGSKKADLDGKRVLERQAALKFIIFQTIETYTGYLA